MKLNRRGYMLIEIILASVLAFGMAYFMISMTIKLKNKNDDLLVETLVSTDQTIVMNAIMRELKGTDCTNVNNKLKIQDKKILIDGSVIDIVNDYVTVGALSCNEDNNIISVNIPLDVKQINDRYFNVELYWLKKGDSTKLYTKTTKTCDYYTTNATQTEMQRDYNTLIDCQSNCPSGGSCRKQTGTAYACVYNTYSCSSGILSGTKCYHFSEPTKTEQTASCTPKTEYNSCNNTANYGKQNITCE